MEGYGNYDLSEDDPYLIPGSTCLDNLLGFSTTKELNAAEAEFSLIASGELSILPVEPTYDLLHLSEIHRRMFGDVYAWAGHTRTVEIAKGGQFFLPWKMIHTDVTETLSALHEELLLADLEIENFANRAGFYLGRINAIHAFREGNGRTQRIMLDQLAENAGYFFEWSAVSGDAMANACRTARTRDDSGSDLSKLLRLHIKPLPLND